MVDFGGILRKRLKSVLALARAFVSWEVAEAS